MNNCILFPGVSESVPSSAGTAAIDLASAAGVRWGWFAELTRSVIGVQLHQWQLEELLALDLAGMVTDDVATLALYATQAAPRPSWWYLRSILYRCAAEGVKTREDWQRRQLRHQVAQSRRY